MLDVKGSIKNLSSTTENHYKIIQNQEPFTRAFPIHFELAYTDFRTIEMALQMTGDQNHSLLVQFSAAYEAVYQYENAYATGGLDGFNEQFGNQIPEYEQAKNQLLTLINQISQLQPVNG
ncbi:hypothetical protein [Levilactobacillus bambusae]|uniref:Uncharacterized protein n=1 Tax=Levilactobacillus bambusae TaxID=2024736 RepID=A0A2V1MXA9_9LACO|nr:hypothetical protein [Levilactobacillus bambusae]PWF99700.1 hypothetical protein DCM90_07475 [Levilactobacillus bambusae]